jgi:hypothetical protein
VVTLLKQLPPGRATGPDALPAEFLRAAPDAHAPWIQSLFRWLWAEGLVPTIWRTSFLHPVYKGRGSRADAGNYRGISLMSHLRKCFETAAARALESAVGPRGDHQHGFVDGRSISGPVWALHTELCTARELQRHPQVLLVDIRKAYDTVDRNILWDKLSSRSRGPRRCLALIRELTDDNIQLVRQPPGVSRDSPALPVPCERGLPQGSALSPILYTYFIDDLPAALHLRAGATCRMYADDIVIRTSGLDTTPAELEGYCARLLSYAARHGFEVNTDKTELLGGLPVSLGGRHLHPRDSSRYLGFRFTVSGADFDATHRAASESASQALRTLSRHGLLTSRFTAERRLHLVKTFVISRLDFASGFPASQFALSRRVAAYHEALTYAIAGTDTDGRPRTLVTPAPPSSEVVAATGLLPYPIRRGAAAWSAAIQAAWAGVPWTSCIPLLEAATFFDSPPAQPATAPPYRWERLRLAAARRAWIFRWASQRICYRPLGRQCPLWRDSEEPWVRTSWLDLLHHPRPRDTRWRAALAATAALARAPPRNYAEFRRRVQDAVLAATAGTP